MNIMIMVIRAGTPCPGALRPVQQQKRHLLKETLGGLWGLGFRGMGLGGLGFRV